MLHLNVNTDAVVALTNKLDKLHKSAFPVAVRTTLNSAAFDMKKDKLLKSAKDVFEQRSPNFFKAFSRVEQAKGFDVGSMKSTVGFTEQGLQGGATNKAVEDLQDQEEGGSISGRSFIPQKRARKAGRGVTKAEFRISDIRSLKFIDADKVSFKGSYRRRGQRFIRAAIKAKMLYGNNAYILGNYSPKGTRTLFKVSEISSDMKSRKIKIKTIPLYTVKKGYAAKVKPTKFSQRAAIASAKYMEDHYIKAAKKQIERLK